jgi:ferredoxin--NADP+ reductase
MFPLVDKKQLTDIITEYVIEAPWVARNHQAGQFCIVRVDDHSERIPLSIADTDKEAGTITLVVMATGHSTEEMATFSVGDALADVVGPLGHPTEIPPARRAYFVGGGVGVPAGHLMVKALQATGAHVTAIIGFRTQDVVIWEERMRAVADEVVVCTDDGSYGFHGFVTEALREQLGQHTDTDFVITVGPVPMMANVASVTREFGVHTVASLNPLMVDGTGMCGACRVTVGEEIKFACVDGPEFDAHLVDFEELASRLRYYAAHEKEARQAGPHPCKMQAAADDIIAARSRENRSSS